MSPSLSGSVNENQNYQYINRAYPNRYALFVISKYGRVIDQNVSFLSLTRLTLIPKSHSPGPVTGFEIKVVPKAVGLVTQ